MVRKVALIAVEFDDPEDNMMDLSALALFAEIRLEKGPNGGLENLEVTAYSNPGDVISDAKEGIGMYASERTNPPMQVPQTEVTAPVPGR